VVVGDIVEVKGGDRIPADIRIIKGINIQKSNYFVNYFIKIDIILRLFLIIK
jgi:hypothetical protein